jgi:hypothetical protein
MYLNFKSPYNTRNKRVAQEISKAQKRSENLFCQIGEFALIIKTGYPNEEKVHR